MALGEPELRGLIGWLRPSTRTLILPAAAYARLRAGGRLSALGTLPDARALVVSARGSGG